MDPMLQLVITAIACPLLILLPAVLLYVYWISPSLAYARILRGGLVGPKPSFPLGNLREMWKDSNVDSSGQSHISMHDFHHKAFPYFSRWRETYGNVFVYWLGTEPFLYMGQPEFLKQITSGRNDKIWGKPDVFKNDRKPMFGRGLVMVEGEEWYHHRNIIAPSLSATKLNAMMSKMVEPTQKLISNWNNRISSGDAEIDVLSELTRNAAEIIANLTAGISREKSDGLYEKLMTLHTVLFKSNVLVGVPFGNMFQLKRTLRAEAVGREIDQLLLSSIDARIAEMGRNENDRSSTHDDLLGVLLGVNQGGGQSKSQLTSRKLVDEIKTLFFGGHETTGLALTWTLILLAKHQKWQKILRDEVVEICGVKPLDSDILAKLVKMEWVFNEVVRLYPPSPNAQRQSREDIRINNKLIPKGTNMWIDAVGLHHDSSLWGDDVNEFKPERFKDDRNGGCKHRLGFIPFGFGGRICVGRNLTKMEYKIVLSLVLMEFNVSLSPNYRHCPQWALSLRPAHGAPLIFRSIKNNN